MKSLIPSQLDARKTYFILHLLHLDMADLFEEALLIYPDLNLEEKVVFFDNLDNEKYPVYSQFIRNQIQHETKEEILFKIIRILLANREYDLIFDTAFRMKGTRREILVNLIIEAEESGLSQYFARFLSLTEMNAVLVASIGYIMSQEPDEFYVEIHKILFSGVERQIKQKIIRNIKHFNSRNRKRILRQILSHAIVLKGIEKDFLLMIIALQDEEILDASMLDKLLNKVLTMMEETDPENLVNFIYFFDSFKVNTDEHRLFIIEELKMVQNTLFRSNADDTLVNLIYKLVRKMEGLA